MTTPTAERCALGLTPERLSAWRDGLLPPAELARIAAHAATCQACQERLQEFERVGRTLRGQKTPDLRARVWSGLQPRLRESRRAPLSLRNRAVWGSAAALTAAAVLVALFASLLAQRGGSTTPIGGVTPTATGATAAPSPSATASQPPVVAPNGWTAADIGTGYIPAIAFAPSSSSTAYAYQQRDGAITVSVSQDAGATWRQEGTPITGQARCDLSVDPTDARDVLLVCTQDSSSGFAVLRSFDGGATWTKPRLDVRVNCFIGAGWAGPTPLLAFLLCDAQSSETQILASVGHGPFTRLDVNGRLGGVVLGQIPLLGGSASAMYVQSGIMQFDQSGGQMNETTLRSLDGGRTWARVVFSAGGRRIHLLTTSPDGHTFVGVYDGAATQLALSTDNGRSWRKLPAGPADVPSFNDVLVAPDGTIVAVSARLSLVNNPDPRLFELPSGAAAWTAPFTLPANTYPDALALDASGHPTALWASYALGSDWELIAHTL